MINPAAEPPPMQAPVEREVLKPAVNILAWSLVCIGLWLIFQVLTEINALFATPESYAFVTRLSKSLAGLPVFSNGGAPPFVLESGGAQIVALGAFCLFALLRVSIGLALVRAGLHLFSPQIAQKLDRLKERIDSLATSVRSLRIPRGDG